MYEGEATWSAVDRYFIDHLVTEDDALRDARDSAATTEMPQGEDAPNQGAFLAIVAQIAGARRVLEFGTLTGYSTIWLARAVGPSGRVVTFEIDETTAEITKYNFERAGLADRIQIVVGPALDSVRALLDTSPEPFDLVFIDADKPNNPHYPEAALKMSRPGTVIIGDNVARNGAIADPTSDDPRVHGTWALIDSSAQGQTSTPPRCKPSASKAGTGSPSPSSAPTRSGTEQDYKPGYGLSHSPAHETTTASAARPLKGAAQ